MKESDFTKADPKDRKLHVVRPFEQIPLTTLVDGSLSHLIATGNLTASFLTMEAGSTFEVHTHSHAQLMIVIDGYCDEIIDGKIYRVEKGDVIYLPENIPHGAFIRDVDCHAIDIFVPRREDYLEKYRQQNPQSKLFFDDNGQPYTI